MNIVYLECLLMDNNEILFKGKSLGFFNPEDLKKHAKTKEQLKEVLLK